jgi:hypothetical protein
MTSTAITAQGLSSVLSVTWVYDDLAHVLEHADTDDPPAQTAAPAHRLLRAPLRPSWLSAPAVGVHPHIHDAVITSLTTRIPAN